MSKRCSLILLTYNGAEYVTGCLESLLPQLGQDDELIVVDNASTDDTLDRLSAYGPPVRVLGQIRNLGYAAGNNRGLAVAQGQVLVLLNQDTVVDRNWLAALLETFDSDPTIGIVGCKSHYRDRTTLQHAGGWIERPSGFSYHFGDGERDAGQFDAQREVEYVSGFAIAIRRDLVDTVGELDESFFPAYGEEIDYCLRARALGWRVVYQPAAIVCHLHPGVQQREAFAQTRMALTGRLRVVLRHWSPTELEAWLSWENALARRPHRGQIRAALAQAYTEVTQELDAIGQRRLTGQGYAQAWDDDLQTRIGLTLTRLRQELVTALRRIAGDPAPDDLAAAGEQAAIVQFIRDRRNQDPVLPGHPLFGPATGWLKAWIGANVVEPHLHPVWEATEASADHLARLERETAQLQQRLDALWGLLWLIEIGRDG